MKANVLMSIFFFSFYIVVRIVAWVTVDSKESRNDCTKYSCYQVAG